MTEAQAPLILCMENATGEEVALRIEPDDNFQMFLDKARTLLGYDVDINSITRNIPVSLSENVYQFLINSEQNLQADDLTQNFDPMLDTNDGANDLVYILDDGTQIRASQIHFDNDDPLVDLTAEKIPFVKYADDITDVDFDDIGVHEVEKINICESPVSRWSSKNSSPKCSFVNSLPFKLVCNNTSGFEAQFTKYLEANNTKTYATLNPVTSRNKSPKSLIKDNFKNYDDNYHRNDNLSYTREEILNMFKDSPMTSLPYDQGYSERRHVRKTDPSRLVHKTWSKPLSYVDIDGVLIGESESQICFICGKHVDNNVDKLYLFDNEDQRLHRCSPQKKMSTQLKIICECCLNENFTPCRMKSANQFLNPDEYLVIRNNQQYIFQKVKNFNFAHLGKPKETITKIDKKIDKEEFVKVEIGSDGEIITKPIDNRSDDVIIVKDEHKEGSSSDLEIVEPEPEIDNIIDNLEEADEEVKEFLGKYQVDDSEVTELKCRFCEKIFPDLTAVADHCETHKHDLEDGEVFPCPLCNYGYANLKWLKAHVKAAHEKTEAPKVLKEENETMKEENKDDEETATRASSPIATRTRSSSKKEDGDRKENEKSDEIKADSNTETVTEPPIIKTEVKQECVDSSEDEIWIVQTGDVEDTQELQKLLCSAKVKEDGQDGESEKTPKCFNCSQVFANAEGLSNHRCRRRNRKRKSKDLVNLICIPTEEDFLKRAQGRPRPPETTIDNDLLVMLPRKRRNREPTSNPQVVTCHNCNKSFTSKVRLKFHMQFHETSNQARTDGRYSCSECDDATFVTETELFDHVHFQHDKQKRWQCPVEGCGKTFFLRATLTKHSRTHTDTRRYVCVTCNKRFLDKQTLDEHGVTHLQIKPFQCHICLKQLTRRSRLRMHVRAHEEELAPRLVMVCAVCTRAFRDHRHAQEHATKSTECIEAFANELKEEAEEVSVQLSPTSGLVRHAVQIVESPKLSKPIKRQVSAEVASPLLSQLADEARALIRVVEIEKAFRCEYCEDVFYLEGRLNAHRVIHKGVKNPFTCHICKVSFATYSRCTTHKTTHGFYKRSLADAKKQADGHAQSDADSARSATGILGYGDFPVVKHFLCEDCGRSYLHWTYLQVHRRMKHANENFLYNCNQCELTFPNSWSLAYHRKKVHGKTGADDPGTSNKNNRDDYRIPCRDCSEVLPNKTALYKHRKKEHSDGTTRGYTKPGMYTSAESESTGGACPHCQATFTHATDLHKHVKEVHGKDDDSCQSCNKTSTGEGTCPRRPHACPVCGHAFRTLSMRNEHLRVHTGERPFPCDVCGVAFRRSTAMRNHRLIHTGVRAWACGRCPKRFRIRSDLRTHLRLKHPATIVVVEMEGLNPTSEEVLKALAVQNVPHDKLIDITKMSFAKGSTSVIPSSARALSALNNVPRTHVACIKPEPTRMLEESQPARRGRGIAKNPRRPKILQRGEDDPQDNSAFPIVGGEELSDLNVQLLLRDGGVLVNGNQMVQLQLDDPILMDVFYLEGRLNAHRVIHKGVKNPFTCHICKVSFATYSRCTTHKTTHGFYKRSLADAKKQADGHAQSDADSARSATGILGYGDFPVVKHFLCEDCGRSYLHWTYLQVHRRMKHANENFLYNCNQCELTFPNSWSLAYHRKKVHGKTGADDPGTSNKNNRDDYRIPCRDCSEVLPNKTALYKHRKKEHSDGTTRGYTKPGMYTSAESESTGGACPHCQATFTHATDLHKHVKEVHDKDDDSCQSCNKTSTGEGTCPRRPHACPVCGHAFRTLSMRNEHLRVHTGERPFPCDVCGVAFRRSTAMRNHRLIHTGVRAWACGRCPKRFRIRSDLRTHLRLKHPATIVVVEMEGLNPTSEEVLKALAVQNVPHDKLIDITKMSFAKGSTSVIPSSARALSALNNVPRTHVACIKPEPTRMLEESQPARRGRGIAKNPRRPKILQRGEDDPQDNSAFPIVGGEELSDLNVQLLLRDGGVLVNGNQMVQLQLDDPILME